MKDACGGFTRRDWFTFSGLAAGAMAAKRAESATQAPPASAAPAAPVSVAKVRTYSEDLVAHFQQMFDQIGGVGNRVRGKTVAIKVNLTGDGRFDGYTTGETHWVHPKVVGAVTAVLGKLGAKRIRILES